jgi:hypothetical protein
MSDADFLKTVSDGDWSPTQTATAKKLRRIIADLSRVVDEEILPQYTFHRELSKHGFWKHDYDVYELSRVIKDQIGIDISGRVPGCHSTFELIQRPDISVRSFIRSIVELSPGERKAAL